MKASWQLVDAKKLLRLHEINEILLPYKNWHNYRQMASTLKNAFLPYLGIMLTDCTFADDAQKTEERGLGNVRKAVFFSTLIAKFLSTFESTKEIDAQSFDQEVVAVLETVNWH